MDLISPPAMFLTTSPSVDLKMPYSPSWNITQPCFYHEAHFLKKKDNGLMTVSLIMNLVRQQQAVSQKEWGNDILKTQLW